MKEANLKPRAFCVLIFIALTLSNQMCVAQAPLKSHGKPDSILDKDHKLDSRMNAEYVPLQGSGLFKLFWSKTGYEFETEEGAIAYGTAFISVGAKGATTRELMENFATYWKCRWKKTPKGYNVIAGHSMLTAVFAPKTPAWERVYAAGAEFVSGIKNLSESKQAQLGSRGMIRVSELPPSMISSATKMFASLETQLSQSQPMRAGDLSSHMNELSIGLTSQPRGDFTEYSVSYNRNRYGSGGFGFYDYHTKKDASAAENEKLISANKPGALYDPDLYELDDKELDALPIMKSKVSISLKYASLVQVLAKLHQDYHIQFVCASPDKAPDRANISLSSLTLREAMNKLQRVYKDTNWVWTRSNFLVVRGPVGLRKTDIKGSY